MRRQSRPALDPPTTRTRARMSRQSGLAWVAAAGGSRARALESVDRWGDVIAMSLQVAKRKPAAIEELLFFRRWLAHPLKVGAVLPSSQRLRGPRPQAGR